MERRRCGAILLALFAMSAVTADAQGVTGRTPATDSVFRRAIDLVNDGEGATGRALLDSMVTAARSGSLEQAEALYWRATVAPGAAEAERDYRRIILDHSLSPRIPEALLRLAQLEHARGERDDALRRLQRLDAEFPSSPLRARTGYWIARVLLEQNDRTRGCPAVADARARLAPRDVELRNQVEFLAQRCIGFVATITPTAPSPTAPTPAPPPPAATGNWSVQVAAFSVRAQAVALVDRLRRRGYQPRVDGTVAPFRVRIGRYATRAAALAALREMQARGIEGFLVQTDTR